MKKEKRTVSMFVNSGKPITFNPKPNRNDKCWCGSGEKYKNCHLTTDEIRKCDTKK